MTKQLLKQIYNERRDSAFLWIELLLVLVVLRYIIDLVYVTLHIYYQPMGLNIGNTYVLCMNRLTDKSTDFSPELTVKDGMITLREIAGRLSRHPEVESVCISQNSISYDEGCNGASFRFPDNDMAWISTMGRRTTLEYYKVFRFWNIDGPGHESLAKALEKNTMTVPVDIASYYLDATLHGKGLLGKEACMDDTNFHIAALTEPVCYNRYDIAGKPLTGTYIDAYLSDERVETVESIAYLKLGLRVRGGVDSGFVERLTSDADRIYQVGNVCILDVTPSSEIRTVSETDSDNGLRAQFCTLFFLLLDIFLGVIDTFWFHTQQRRREVALRMAMGTNRKNISYHLITESLLLLSTSALPATLVAFNIGYIELVDISQMAFTASRSLIVILLMCLLMATMIILGVLYPVLQSVKVQPAEVLRDE